MIDRINRVIAKVAEEEQAIILDGGTNSGVMASIGRARAEEGYIFPLVGVAVKNLVKWPVVGKKHPISNGKNLFP